MVGGAWVGNRDQPDGAVSIGKGNGKQASNLGHHYIIGQDGQSRIFGQVVDSIRPFGAPLALCYNVRTMVNRDEFEHLVRDALTNLYDLAALEVHPFAPFCPREAPDQSRADALHQVLRSAVESLRPPDGALDRGAVEWRPHLILQGRYVEGRSLQELEERLSLSARQLRREHGRALRAVAAVLRDRVPTKPAAEYPEQGLDAGKLAADGQAYEVKRELLDLCEVVRGVCEAFRQRVQAAGVALCGSLPDDPVLVQADRVVLRQILFSLIGYALHTRSGGELTCDLRRQNGSAILEILSDGRVPPSEALDAETSLDNARHWAERLGATIELVQERDAPGICRLSLSMSHSGQAVVLVIDDQEPAIRLFQRYLSRAGTRVVGLQEPEKALSVARRLQPQAITLDVMMPSLDGWEILQSLRADPETSHIPVIVCSVWDEPELASSLGASAFLKKPVTQRDLLRALADLTGEQDIGAGSSPANT